MCLQLIIIFSSFLSPVAYWPQLFKELITLPVGVHFICCILTYLLDRIIHSLGNWGLVYRYCEGKISFVA